MTKRKTFNSEFKAKVAVEALKGQKTVNEIATEFVVHPTQVNYWKKQLLKGSKIIFNRRQDEHEADFERERDLLYRQIGKLQIEVEVLKKKLGISTKYN